MSRVLVISPHPDDEAIGCGGTLCHHVAHGDLVRVIFLTSGEGGGHGRSSLETAQLREREAASAAEILRLADFEFWHQPDGALRAGRQVVDRLRKLVEEWRPDLLYVTHGREMHPDHRAAARIVRNALSGPGAPPVAPVVHLFEVWTPMQGMDEVVDISDYLECKMAAIRAYRSQCEVVRFDEAAQGLSRYRGELHSWPGGNYAEIFQRMRL